MPRLLFDTSVFIAYRPVKLPSNFFMSAVVIQELAAGAADNSVLQRLHAALIPYEQEGRLLVPTAEDWWLAGKVLNLLFRGLKSTSRGRTVRITKHEQQRILRDVLIARTVKRANATLVTDNVGDFQRIRQFCNVRLLSGSLYFKRERLT